MCLKNINIVTNSIPFPFIIEEQTKNTTKHVQDLLRMPTSILNVEKHTNKTTTTSKVIIIGRKKKKERNNIMTIINNHGDWKIMIFFLQGGLSSKQIGGVMNDVRNGKMDPSRCLLHSRCNLWKVLSETSKYDWNQRLFKEIFLHFF